MHLDGTGLPARPVDHKRFGVLHLENDVKWLPLTYSFKLRREFL
jgi:hypothetical protein